MTEALTVLRVKGQEILPYIPDLAKLRIEIFKDYPYLYEGDLTYEMHYLQTYIHCHESVVAIVLDSNIMVGASTAIPLKFETAEVKKPFIDQSWNIDSIFYLGESVLKPAYRGKNIYRQFFHEREAAAREYGAKVTAFCAVQRRADDHRQPQNYRPLDAVWQRFGYEKHPELCAYYEWKEIGEQSISPKPLTFWLKQHV